MVTMHRDGQTKYVAEEHIEACKAIGWVLEGEESPFDREAAIAKLEEAGIKVHHKTGNAKLKEMVEAL